MYHFSSHVAKPNRPCIYGLLLIRTFENQFVRCSNIDNRFSNLLIIYEEKMMEITAIKEAWKCNLNYHKIW